MDNDDKEEVFVTWTKPDDYVDQDLYLRYTIVEEKRKYWVGIEYPPKEGGNPKFDTSGKRIE